MRCSRDEKFWGDYVIKVVVFTAITIILAGCATYNFRNRDEATAEAMSTYQCDEVVFGYNEDDAASEPLGYYVECRNYTQSLAKCPKAMSATQRLKSGVKLTGLTKDSVQYSPFSQFLLASWRYCLHTSLSTAGSSFASCTKLTKHAPKILLQARTNLSCRPKCRLFLGLKNCREGEYMLS